MIGKVRLRLNRGYNLVEIIVVIVVLAILATVLVVAYNGVQRRAADAQTRSTVADALKILQLYYAENKSYPSNIANTEYAPPLTVAMALYTDAPQTPLYENLNPEQNAQLFLNSCNGFMPVVDGGTTYNDSCVFSGNNIHVKGTISSNVVIDGPTFTQTDFVLSCGSPCGVAQSSIVAKFIEQGGSFPIEVPKTGSTLPAPSTVNVTGPAADFCVEGRSAQYADVVHHALPTSPSIQDGPCPPNANLHYP